MESQEGTEPRTASPTPVAAPRVRPPVPAAGVGRCGALGSTWWKGTRPGTADADADRVAGGETVPERAACDATGRRRPQPPRGPRALPKTASWEWLPARRVVGVSAHAADRSPRILPPVLQRFGDVGLGHAVGAREVGDRARDAQRAVHAAAGERVRPRRAQEAVGGRVVGGHGDAQRRRGDARVGGPREPQPRGALARPRGAVCSLRRTRLSLAERYAARYPGTRTGVTMSSPGST